MALIILDSGFKITTHLIYAFDSVQENDWRMDWQKPNFCGVNCLYFFLKLNRVDLEYNELCKNVTVDINGTSMDQLRKISNEFHCPAIVIKSNPNELMNVKLPAIAHLSNGESNGHYVVIVSIERDADGSETIKYIDGTECRLMEQEAGIFYRSWSSYLLIKDRARFESYLDASLIPMIVLTIVMNLILLGRNRWKMSR